MNTQLNIGQATTVEDLAEWYAAKGNDLRFTVSRNSGFSVGVEGISLGVLRELQETSAIDVDCTFDLLAEERSKKEAARLGIFDGLFGIALVAASRSVRIQSTLVNRSEVLDCLWKRVRAGRGAVGDGKRTSLVSRDPDEPVPECLRSGTSGFPKRDRFSATVLEKSKEIGLAKGGYSKSEEEAITFVFEAARNSFEHARNGRDGSVIRGIRGILVEKMVFASYTEADARSSLTDLQRAYLKRVWGSAGTQRRVLAYTVVDLGPGIQSTLPSTPGESATQRLVRAFRAGETRKPRGTDVEAGLGLPRLCTAAARLRALLLIKSADLAAVADFSIPNPGDQPISLVEQPELGNSGTSITLLWPETVGAGEQGLLF